MSAIFGKEERQALPRCVDYNTACALGLLRVSRKQLQEKKHVGEKTKGEWQENPKLFTAVELVGEALIIKDFESTEADEAARYILSHAGTSQKLIAEMAEAFRRFHLLVNEDLNPTIEEINYGTIMTLKKSVRFYPLNSIAWNDLALSYATMGQYEKFRSAIVVALNLGKTNRYILRSAARCYLHFGEADRAAYILNKSGLCSFDPWITSAEIAISEGTGLVSKCLGKAKLLLEDDNLTEYSKSELASNLGTVQMKYGAVKIAKKMIKMALLDPTENSLAQVQWMTNSLGINKNQTDNLKRLESEVPGSYEAQSLRLYWDLKFEDSFKAAVVWGKFQQLSSKPIVHASHVAELFLQDDDLAIKVLCNSTPAQKNSFEYFNNMAVSLAKTGKISEAEKLIAEIDTEKLSNTHKTVLVATRGLLKFRLGSLEDGRKLYEQAINEFDRVEDSVSAAVASYYFATEEKNAKSNDADKRIKEAVKRLERHKIPPLDHLAKMISSNKRP